MSDKTIEISQGSLVSLRVAVPSPSPVVGGGGKKGGYGYASARRARLSTDHFQSFFINATSKLETKLQAIRDGLIQHSNGISKLSGLSSRMEMLDQGFLMKLFRAIAFCNCKIAILSRAFVRISLI